MELIINLIVFMLFCFSFMMFGIAVVNTTSDTIEKIAKYLKSKG